METLRCRCQVTGTWCKNIIAWGEELMNRKKISDNLDAIANQYNKTKDPYYKDLWYKK